MKNSYRLDKGEFDDPFGDIEIPYRKEEKPSVFHIGSTMDREPAKKLICNKCGNDEFNVGKGSFFTAIRCSKCEWEECVHDG